MIAVLPQADFDNMVPVDQVLFFKRFDFVKSATAGGRLTLESFKHGKRIRRPRGRNGNPSQAQLNAKKPVSLGTRRQAIGARAKLVLEDLYIMEAQVENPDPSIKVMVEFLEAKWGGQLVINKAVL